MRATLCILDSRLLLDEKSASNENFRDQLAAADIIVANKSYLLRPKVSKRYSVGGRNGGDHN